MLRAVAAAPRPVLLAGRYELIGPLGAGGMGAVHRARDIELDEVVAVKILRPELTRAPESLARFRNEVRLARRVTHRNVARVFDIGDHAGTKFLTMELVDGTSLGAILAREGCLSVARVVGFAVEICAGLAAAHTAGVVHRDLKPDNVLVERSGRVVLADFGIARALVPVAPGGEAAPASIGLRGGPVRGAVGATLAGLVGTPAYMAPEQVVGAADIDGRADLYALGAMLFELLTGALPWDAPSELATAFARLHQPPPDPRARCPQIPADIAKVVLRCMATAPTDRYPTARALLRELRRLRPERDDETLVDLGAPPDSAYVLPASPRSAPGPQRSAPRSVPGRGRRTAARRRPPADPVALDLYLEGRHEHGRFWRDANARAVDLLRMAHARSPDDPVVSATYAMALARRFALEDGADDAALEAEDLASRALAACPGLGEAHLARAIVRLNRGAVEEAAAEIARALALAPALAEAQDLAGDLLVELGAAREGIQRLEAAAALEPRLFHAHVRRARAHALLGEDAACDAVFSDCPPEGTDARNAYWITRVRVALWRGERSAAAELRRGIAAAPFFFSDVCLELCDLLETGRVPRALVPRIESWERGAPRRLVFLAQLRVEIHGAAGDVRRALAALATATRGGLVDLMWLDHCAVLAPLREHAEFTAARTVVAARAARALDALDA